MKKGFQYATDGDCTVPYSVQYQVVQYSVQYPHDQSRIFIFLCGCLLRSSCSPAVLGCLAFAPGVPIGYCTRLDAFSREEKR